MVKNTKLDQATIYFMLPIVALGIYMYNTQYGAPETFINMSGGSNDKSIVLFYAPWCPHCVTFRAGEGNSDSEFPNSKPNKSSEWGKFYYAAKQNGVNVIEYDVDANPDIVKPFANKIQGYPTVVMMSNGKINSMFSGERKASALHKFAKKM
jgi:thiol-disulfide isomerase/thioredoxin